jgi:hypothetical protein
MGRTCSTHGSDWNICLKGGLFESRSVGGEDDSRNACRGTVVVNTTEELLD